MRNVRTSKIVKDVNTLAQMSTASGAPPGAAKPHNHLYLKDKIETASAPKGWIIVCTMANVGGCISAGEFAVVMDAERLLTA